MSWEKIEEINEALAKQGSKIVQKIPAAGGRTLYGYIPQAVFDEVNRVIGPDNWETTNLEWTIKEIGGHDSKRFQAHMMVKVSIDFEGGKDKEKWVSREAFGGSENYSPGDALKGAETDAIQKALALFSIGRIAYRGELAGSQANKPQQKTHTSKPKASDGKSPSQKQINYFKSLLEQAYKAGKITEKQRDDGIKRVDSRGYTSATISKSIEVLKEMVEGKEAETEEVLRNYHEDDTTIEDLESELEG